MKNNKGSVGAFFLVIVLAILLALGVCYVYFNFIQEDPIDQIKSGDINSGEIIMIPPEDNNENLPPIREVSGEAVHDQSPSGEELSGEVTTPPEQNKSGENTPPVVPPVPSQEMHYITLNNSSVRSLLRSISVNDELLEVVIKRSPNKIFEYDFGTIKLDGENYNLYFSIIYNQSTSKFLSTAYIKSDAGVRVVIYEDNSLAIDTPLLTTFMDKYISKYIVTGKTTVHIEVCSHKSTTPIFDFDIELGAKPLRLEYTDTGIKYCSYDTPHTVMGNNSRILHKLAATYYEILDINGELVKNVVSVDTTDYIDAK